MMVIEVAKDGYNVLTETNPNNLNYSSQYDTLKYYEQGIANITVPSSGGSPAEYESVVFTHNLGYKPNFTVILEDENQVPTQFYLMPFGFADFMFYLYFDVYVTNTELIFRADHSGLGDSIPLKLHYKLFRNDLGL